MKYNAIVDLPVNNSPETMKVMSLRMFESLLRSLPYLTLDFSFYYELVVERYGLRWFILSQITNYENVKSTCWLCHIIDFYLREALSEGHDLFF